MKILSVDPGTNRCGWALVTEGATARRARYLASGIVDAEPIALSSLIAEHAPDLVAIESVVSFGMRKKEHVVRAPHLMATSGVARLIEGICFARGVATFSMPARKWRRIFCGNGSAPDAQIKRACELLIDKMPGRTNAHERDALGLGVVAMWHGQDRARFGAVGAERNAALARAKGLR